MTAASDQPGARFPEFLRAFDAGARTKTESLDKIVHRLVANLQSQLDRSHIARLRKRFSNSQDSEWMMVVNEPPGNSDRAHLAIDPVVRLDGRFVDSRGVSDDFEGRARLVDVLQSPIGARLHGHRPGDIWVKGGRVGGRESHQCRDQESRCPILHVIAPQPLPALSQRGTEPFH